MPTCRPRVAVLGGARPDARSSGSSSARTRSPRRSARERANVDLVILAGGDGTMNAAADALVECRLPFGILPTGTANDLARTLGIPTDLAAAAAVIGAGRRHRDRPRPGQRQALLQRRQHRPVGRGHPPPHGRAQAALLAVRLRAEPARRLADHPAVPRPADAATGSATRLRAIQITVGNGRHYGGGMTVSEDAAIDDGWLDVYCLRAGQLLAPAGAVPGAAPGPAAAPRERPRDRAAGRSRCAPGGRCRSTPTASSPRAPRPSSGSCRARSTVFVPASYQSIARVEDHVAAE